MEDESLLKVADKKSEEDFRAAVRDIADKINQRERKKLEVIYTGQTANLERVARERGMKKNTKSTGEANWRKIYEVPVPVARWMEDTYKMPFSEIAQHKELLKNHPEWFTMEAYEL